MIFKDTDDLSQNENMSQNNSSTENSNYFQGTMYQGGSDPETPHTEKPRKKKAGKGLVKKAAFCAVLGLTFGVCSGSGVWAVQQFTGTSASQLASTTGTQSSGTGTTASGPRTPGCCGAS